MHLEKVVPTIDQLVSLYAQLRNRVHNISHSELPSFKEHENFVEHHPYRAWFIVKLDGKCVGNIYVQFDNSIGLSCDDGMSAPQISNILNLIFSKMDPLEAIPSVRYGSFFLNVPSSNTELQKKLSSLGFLESQRTYIMPSVIGEFKLPILIYDT